MEWISVKDRLPKKGEHVLCSCFEDFMQVAMYDGDIEYSDGLCHTFKNLYEDFITVDYWMPLPKPPT